MREPHPDWSPLGVNFKILDEHPHLFLYNYFKSPPPPGDQTFSSNIVFVAHRMAKQVTVFDQILNKMIPYNAFYVLPWKFCRDVTQIRYMIGCFFSLGLALFAEVAK